MKRYEKFSKEELQDIINSSFSFKEVVEKIGLKCNTPIKFVKQIAEEYDLEITHLRRSGHDLRNQIFGKLTVLSVDINNKDSHTYWICQCTCGNIISVRSQSLIEGHTKQCELCHNTKSLKNKNKNIEEPKKKIRRYTEAYNMIGKRFGKLQVVSLANKTDSSRRLYWNCNCDCGSKIVVSGPFLRSGNTQSCGCLLSKGEEKIATILKDMNIPFLREYSFKDLKGHKNNLRFDFYLQSLNCCIEFQGKQHFYPVSYFGGTERFQQQKEYDILKREYCNNNNIKLIEIPYTDYNILDQEYILNLINN